MTIASTGKDSATGRMIAQEYRVQGPVALFFTTTSVEIDEELANRCIVLTVDEDREQTEAIHQQQRERQTLAGIMSREIRSNILKLHQNAQRLLQPLLVVNPFAPRLTFQAERTRARRDHLKYLGLIRAIGLLHQHQRDLISVDRHGRRITYMEVTPEDIGIANKLVNELFGNSLDDLPPHSRKLLLMLHGMVMAKCDRLHIDQSAYRFGRKEIREFTAWSYPQVRDHLAKLLEMEYILAHRDGPGYINNAEFDWQILQWPFTGKFPTAMTCGSQASSMFDALNRIAIPDFTLHMVQAIGAGLSEPLNAGLASPTHQYVIATSAAFNDALYIDPFLGVIYE